MIYQTPSEAEVRKMRDRVFNQKISDNEWLNCKEKWLEKQEVAWLKEQMAKAKK